MTWAKTEISVSKTNDRGDAILFNIDVKGKPPITERNKSFSELVEILKEIYLAGYHCLTLIVDESV